MMSSCLSLRLVPRTCSRLRAVGADGTTLRENYREPGPLWGPPGPGSPWRRADGAVSQLHHLEREDPSLVASGSHQEQRLSGHARGELYLKSTCITRIECSFTEKFITNIPKHSLEEADVNTHVTLVMP